MYQFYQEQELFRPIYDYFKKQGYVVRFEIRIGFCRADIVAFKKDETIAVELKINDWKKAIIQAKNYQLGCDYTYIVFPLNRVFNVLRRAEFLLKKEGIGLLVIKERTSEVCKIIDAEKSCKKMGSVTMNKFL